MGVERDNNTAGLAITTANVCDTDAVVLSDSRDHVITESEIGNAAETDIMPIVNTTPTRSEVVCKNDKNGSCFDEFSMDDVARHCATTGDKWMVIDGFIYDVTGWQRLHPGGARVLSYFIGLDATDIAQAIHSNRKIVDHFMKAYRIGKIADSTIQMQAGWVQHDYGHSSVFPSSKLNRIAHQLIIGHFKGASSHWWRFRHFRHHAAPNNRYKDPDVQHMYLFLVDKETAHLYGANDWGFMPYDWQHIYYWFLGPPFLFTFYFQLENAYFVIKRRDYLEIGLMLSFFVRFAICFVTLLGVTGTVCLYVVVRLLEGYWLVTVTQSNHLPMEFSHSPMPLDFIRTQSLTTCNIQHSTFNDWFTGHTNFHLEHHLFPTMPRHNYVKVAPLVKKLFDKHGIAYVEKPLFSAMKDLFTSLKTCGQVWRIARDSRGCKKYK